MKNGVLSSIVVAAMIVSIPLRGPAQTTPAPQASISTKEAPLFFDVASVKQNQNNASPKSNIPLGPGDASAATGGIFSGTNMPVIIYIMFAYDLTGNQMAPILNQLPSWASTERFDIEARSGDQTVTKKQMRLMMQSLLADRFKLVVHQETHQGSVLALVVAKPGKLGPRLQPHAANTPCATATSNSTVNPSTQTSVVGGFPVTCGTIASLPTTGLGQYAFGARNVSMGFIANLLGAMPELGRPVIDHTGLSGTFDFKLEFTPQMNGVASAYAGTSLNQSEPAGTTLIEAVMEQLGLKFTPQQGSVEAFVVDHVEHPSSN